MSDPLASRTQAQFSKMLRNSFGEYLKDNMRTSVPGHVLSFDPDTQAAEVQIGLMLEDRQGAQQPRAQSSGYRCSSGAPPAEHLNAG
jgi:hypothetical protein